MGRITFNDTIMSQIRFFYRVSSERKVTIKDNTISLKNIILLFIKNRKFLKSFFLELFPTQLQSLISLLFGPSEQVLSASVYPQKNSGKEISKYNLKFQLPTWFRLVINTMRMRAQGLKVNWRCPRREVCTSIQRGIPVRKLGDGQVTSQLLIAPSCKQAPPPDQSWMQFNGAGTSLSTCCYSYLIKQ